MREVFNTDSVPQSTSPVSQATFARGFVFVGGQMPRDAESGTVPSDPTHQTQLSMQHCLDILRDVGGAPEGVMLVFVYLTDLAHKPAVDTCFQEVFGDNPPARNLIEVSAIGDNAAVEFALIATI